MHEPFVDDRLEQDMTEIRKIMKKQGTNPIFKLEFRRTNDNDIALVFTCEGTTMPAERHKIDNLNQIGDLINTYIKETSEWV